MDGVVVCRTLLTESGFVSDQCMYVCTYVHTCVTTVASDTAVCV